MSVKEDLQEMRLVRKLIQAKSRQIKELEDTKISIKSPQITGLPKGQARSNTNKLDKILDEINKLQDIKAKQLEELISLEKKYNEAVAKLPVTHRLIIELRYFENESYTWGKIADKIGYEIRQVYNLHGQALMSLRNILNIKK